MENLEKRIAQAQVALCFLGSLTLMYAGARFLGSGSFALILGGAVILAMGGGSFAVSWIFLEKVRNDSNAVFLRDRNKI